MSLTTTSAPSSAKRCAMPSPKPEPAPVTIATLPFSRMPPPQSGAEAPSGYAEILELPGIIRVEIFGEEDSAIEERRPVAIGADDGAEIGHADLEHAREIHLVRLDDPRVRILERPDQPSED